MFSWDPDDVEKIAPFTPSCHQSTWRIDDVDRITPFIPIRQYTWTVDDVDHIESFVPSVSPALRSSSSSSSQYDTAISGTSLSPNLPFVPDSGVQCVQSSLDTFDEFATNISSDSPVSAFRNNLIHDSVDNTSSEFGAQHSEVNFSQLVSVDQNLHCVETGTDESRSPSQSSKSASNSLVMEHTECGSDALTEYSHSRATRSNSSRSILQHTQDDLDSSAEFVDPKCSSSPVSGPNDILENLNTSNEYDNPKFSSSNHYISVSNNENRCQKVLLQDTSNSMYMSDDDISSSEEMSAESVMKDKDFDVAAFLRTIDHASNCNATGCCDTNSPVYQGEVRHSSATSRIDFDTLAEYLGQVCSSRSLNSDPDSEHKKSDFNCSNEHDDSSSSISGRRDRVEKEDNFDVAAFLRTLDYESDNQSVASNSSDSYREYEDVLQDGSGPMSTLDDDDSPLFGNTEGSLEMSTEFVIQEPVEDSFLHTELSNNTTSNFSATDSLDTSSSSEDDEPLPVHQGEMESYSSTADTYNPYPLSRTCIAAPNSIGRGKDLSSGNLEVNLKEEFLRRRLRMDGDFVPSMGRGAILETYYNRHRTDESLNKQLRTTLGVGYSNEVTEHFWRGEQEESEPAEKTSEREAAPPVEVDDLIPAAESVSLLSPDIILVSPGNTIGPKKSAASPKKPSVPFQKSSDAQGMECVSRGNTISSASPKKPSVPFEKSADALGIKFVSPGNTIGPRVTTVTLEKSTTTQSKKVVESRVSSSASVDIPLEQTSPKKKKKSTSVRKNRNALLNSLANQKEAQSRTTPGMPPGALTYVHLDTSENYKEQKDFHYEKEDFPPLC